jgi:hypothetical protein
VEESQRIGVEFLIADLSIALTFLDIAEATESEGHRQRNRQNALAAHATVMRLLPRLSPSPDERRVLESRLAKLRERLQELGFDVGPATEAPSGV